MNTETMKILIIEDEPMAQASLAKNISRICPDAEICGMTSSVEESVGWLRVNRADVIFMDVELSDGNCFEIFRQVDVKADVIMTTAYDNYAVKAFEEGSIDYLLKPIGNEALQRALSRVHRDNAAPDWQGIFENMMKARENEKRSCSKDRFIVRFNDKIVPVKASEIACFFSEDKCNFLVTDNGNCFVVDATLDEIAERLDRERFFRISRSCIVSSGAISSITRLQGGRLRICPSVNVPCELVVSRSRSEDFLNWLEN